MLSGSPLMYLSTFSVSLATNLLSSAALAVLTTRPACPPSLILCLSSLGESLPSMPYVYSQSLKALSSQSVASGSESYVPGVVSE
ncbi:hypothetical protein Tco_0622592 [Tanacetum coccineum]